MTDKVIIECELIWCSWCKEKRYGPCTYKVCHWPLSGERKVEEDGIIVTGPAA